MSAEFSHDGAGAPEPGAAIAGRTLAGLPVRGAAPAPAGTRRRHGPGLAIVVGINAYYDNDLRLDRARHDAEAVGDRLHAQHCYDTVACLDTKATLDQLRAITKEIPTFAARYRRLVFFFSGHGRADEIADETAEETLVGSLLPCDVRRDDVSKLFPMKELCDALRKLQGTACRHVLVILDCCSAGAFARTREAKAQRPNLAEARFEWVTRHTAAQVLASAGHNEVAFDSIPMRKEADARNSPFTTALLQALQTPATGRDGVVLATDLYLFIQDELYKVQQQQQQQQPRARQTPMLFTLPWHAGGDFAFLVKDEPVWRTPPDLSDPNVVPYIGLRPFTETDERLFFGREALVAKLGACAAEQGRKFLVVTGASGVGKSSLLAAGLVPELRKKQDWVLSKVLRPGVDPDGTVRAEVRRLVPGWDGSGDPSAAIQAWAEKRRTLVLVLDQLEELVTRSGDTKADALAKLIGALVQTECVKVLGAVRAGFDAETLALFAKHRTPPKNQMASGAEDLSAIIVPPMSRAELGEVIERPAEERVIFFEAKKGDRRTLVDAPLDAVEVHPGSLPLLSLTLNALYVRARRSGGWDRTIRWEDLEEVGGVAGALTRVAEQAYNQPADYDRLDGERGSACKPSEAHQATVRRILLRMVQRGSSGWTRRSVPLAELTTTPESNDRTLAAIRTLVSARLVVESEGLYEPAHDLLVEGWRRLRDWLAADGERILVTRALTDAAVGWVQAKDGQRSALLWGDHRLVWLMHLRRRPDGHPDGAHAAAVPATQALLEALSPDQFVAALEPDWLTENERKFVRKSVARRRDRAIGAVVAASVAVGAVALGVLAARANEQRSAADEVNQLAGAARRLQDDPTKVSDVVVHALAVYAERQQRYGQHPPDALGPLAEIAEHRNDLPIGSAAVKGTVTDVRADGNGLAVLLYDKDLRFWRIDREGHSREIPLIPPPQQDTTEGRFSPDGRLVAAVGEGAVHLWDAATGAGRRPLPRSPGLTAAPAFSGDGQRIAALSNGDGVHVWDVDGGNPEPVLWKGSIRSVTLDATGSVLAVVPTQGFLGLARGRPKDAAHLLTAPEADQTVAVAFSPDDGRWMVTGRTDNQVILWSAADGRLMGTLGEHSGQVNLVAFAPRGNRVLSGGMDSLCRLWDVNGRARERSPGPAVLVGGQGEIQAAAFTSNGRGVVAGGSGESRPLLVWSAEPVGLRLNLAHSGAVTTAAWAPGGETIVTGSVDQTVRVWSVRDGLVQQHRSRTGQINAVAFEPHGKWFVEARKSAEQPLAYVWKAEPGEPIELQGHRNDVLAVAVSTEGLIATGSEDGTARLWTPDGHALGAPLGHAPATTKDRRKLQPEHRVLGVAWSSDGRRVLTIGDDQRVVIWDAETHVLLHSLAGHTDEVTSASFSPNNAYVLSASRDGRARLWRADSGDLVVELRGHKGPVTRARFAPAGDVAVTAGEDGTVRLWRVPSGELLHVFEGHAGPVLDVAVSPSGAQLASGGEDGTVRLWDPRLRTLQAVFNAHGGRVHVGVVAYRSDGKRVLSAGDDGYVHVFPTSADEPLDELCEALAASMAAKAPATAVPAAKMPAPPAPERTLAELFCNARHADNPRDLGAAWRHLYPEVR